MDAANAFKLALIQMRIRPGDKTANLAHAVELVAQAAAEGAQVAVLPEALPLGWTHPSAATLADEIPAGESFRRLSETARRHRIHLCSGLIERAGPNVYNAAVLFSPDGELLLHHRKINELDIGHDCYALGDRLGVARTPLGSLGLMICADGFALGQVISRALGMMGADLILAPSSWAVPADHDNARDPYGKLWLDNFGPVAHDYGLWIAGVSSVGPITAGPWAGRKCIGCSLLVDPAGQAARQGPYGENAEAILYHSVAIGPKPRPWFEPKL